MSKRVILILIAAVITTAIWKSIPTAQASEGAASAENQAIQQLQVLLPVSVQLVDQAIVVLSQGWSGMSQAERNIFIRLYDPANSGDFDDQYITQVTANYQKIRKTLNGDVPVVYAENSDECEGQRLYFTDLTKLYVCPYFFEEENNMRKARTLIHEMAHIALMVTDRAYYRPTSKAYAKLTPNGSWVNELPVAGRVMRELLKGDTLYHPDAYAHFALKISGYDNIYAVNTQ